MRNSTFGLVRGLVLLLLAVTIGSCRHITPTQPAPSDCCQGVITVVAHDANNAALSGASVTLNGTKTDGTTVTRGPETTNADGTTSFRELCPGRYEIQTALAGYTTTSSVVELGCNDTVHILTTLQATQSNDCNAGVIELSVFDSVTSALLSGGNASLYHNGHLVSTKTIGSARWDGLGTGRYSFTLSKDGYRSPISFDIDSLLCNEHRGVHHAMAPLSTNNDSCCSGVLELKVADSATLAGIGGATVTVVNRTTSQTQTATSDQSGGVRFANLCPGNILVTITKDGYNEVRYDFLQTCDLRQGGTKFMSATHTNCCTAILALNVVDSAHHDTKIAGATVTIRIDGHNDNWRTGTTTDGGNYTTDGVCGHTTYIVSVIKDGYNTQSFVWQLGDCTTLTQKIYLGAH